MNVAENLKSSWESLKINKIIVLPIFAAPVIFMIAGFLFLYFFGFLSTFSEHSRLYEEYRQQSKGLFFNQEKFDEYLEANNFRWDFSRLLNINSIAIIIISAVLLALAAYYLKCISYGMTALVARKAKLTWKAATKLANKFFWKLMLLHLFLFLIAFAIVIVLGIIAVIGFLISKWLGILVFILCGILMICVLFFMVIKLFFGIPILCLEGKTAKESLKQSYSMTRGRFREALIVFAVIVGIGLALGIFGNLFSVSFANIMSPSPAKSSISLAVILIYYLLSSAVGAFTTLFWFYAYADFKKRKVSKAKAF